MKFADNYEKYFETIGKKSPLHEFFALFMFNLPHFITIAILVALFPHYWAGICLLGWVIPDFPVVEYYSLKLIGKKEAIKNELNRKKISEIVTFIASMILLILGLWEISLAGFIHLFLDYLGF